MKNIFLLAGLGLSLSTHASISVLKVVGTNCNTQKVEVAGSGVVFNEKGQQYLVTSEHVAPTDSKLCYTGAASSVDGTKMTLVSSDWEAGLALFKIDKPRSNSTATLQDFAAPRERSGDTVRAVGYASVEYGQINDRARVTTTGSDRTAFVDPRKNVEVAGVTNEHGLSGGALMDEYMKEVLGILSHQRIKAKPGSSSELVLLAQNTVKDPLVLSAVAIPGDRVKEWADNTINKNSKPNYSRDKDNNIRGLGLQLQEQPRRSESLRMKDLESDDRKGESSSREETMRLGGDGVGIGGRPGQEAITLKVSLVNLAELKAANQNLPEVQWISQLAPALMANPVIHVRGMVVFSGNGEIQVEGISSAADFFRKIRSGKGFPLLEEKLTTKIAVEKNPNDLESVFSIKTESEETQDLFEKIKAVRTLKAQYPQLRIPVAYMQKLLKHPGWGTLADENFEASVQAGRYLLQLQ